MNSRAPSFAFAPKALQLGLFREWMSQQHEQHQGFFYSIKEYPVWMFLIQEGLWDCLDELLHVQEMKLIHINGRDQYGRGWLHYCIYHNAPTKISIAGLHMLDEHWNAPDSLNNDPMEALPSTDLAQAMATKRWGERKKNTKTYFLKLIDQAQKAKRSDLQRIWSFWNK